MSLTDKICENVKRLSKKQRIALGEIEKKAEVGSGYLSRCKRGNCMMSIDRVYKFAEILGVTINELTSEIPVPHWERESDRPDTYIRICSECGERCWYIGNGDYRFCPNCGIEILKKEN